MEADNRDEKIGLWYTGESFGCTSGFRQASRW